MGRRRDKALAVSRYITATTGIPFIRWNGTSIDAPDPYRIELITDAMWWRFGEKLREATDTVGIPVVIRYDGYVDGVENAIVGTTLKAFTELMKIREQMGDTHGTTTNNG